MYQTPSASGEFRDEFGTLTNMEAARLTLEGIYQPPPMMNKNIKQLLRHLKRPDGVEEIPALITTKEYQANWTKARERTLSSPHNVHFGHFKAIARDKGLVRMMAMLMSIPILTGFSPRLYQK